MVGVVGVVGIVGVGSQGSEALCLPLALAAHFALSTALTLRRTLRVPLSALSHCPR